MSEAPLRVAATLADRYRIEREVGQGGMATVFLAHAVKHDRRVALEVLKPELAAVLSAERFLTEIETAATCNTASGRCTIPARCMAPRCA